jgi:hypothetical protein
MSAGRGSQRPARGRGASMWDWFLLGAGAGALYSLFRNPGGCACCGGCLVLLGVLAIVLAVVAIERNVVVLAVVFAIAVAFFLWRKQKQMGG